MALGAAAIALASATGAEHRRWQEAAARDAARYGTDPAYVQAALAGESVSAPSRRRTWLDWTLVGGTTAVFVGRGAGPRGPGPSLGGGGGGGRRGAMVRPPPARRGPLLHP